MRLKAGYSVLWKGIEETVAGSTGNNLEDYLITLDGSKDYLQVVNGLALEIETFYNYCPDGPGRQQIMAALRRVEEQGKEWGIKAVEETFNRLEAESN